MKRILIWSCLLFAMARTGLKAQETTFDEWLIGVNLPIPNFESNIGDATIGLPDAQFVAPHHVLRPGISIGYNGWAANLYLVAINPFISHDPDNTDYYLSPPTYENTFPLRYNLGYQYCFNGEQEAKFKPLLGAFYGIGPRTNLEFTTGLRYGQHQFLMGVYLESNRHLIPIGDRWMETSVNFKYQYLIKVSREQLDPKGPAR